MLAFKIFYADDTTLMVESEGALKTFFMKVKEKSEKAGLKLNISKTKIMASSPITLGFLHSSVGKESACNAGDLGSIPGLGRSPGEGNSYPLPPWGHKESDTTERLSLSHSSSNRTLNISLTVL